MNACLKIPNIKFKAVCDIWTDYNQKRVYRMLKKYGHELNAYVDYKEMLAKEKDLDAVIVATPDFWHARHTIAALDANGAVRVDLRADFQASLESAQGERLFVDHLHPTSEGHALVAERLLGPVATSLGLDAGGAPRPVP